MNSIGYRLTFIRKNLGYSQKEIAQVLRVTPSTYSNYENDVFAPHILKCIKLAEFYNVSLDYLLGRCEMSIEQSELHNILFNNSEKASIINKIIALSAESTKDLNNYIDFQSFQNKTYVAETTLHYAR